jgi:hypothetical protein
MIVLRDLGEVGAKDFDGCEVPGAEEGLQLGCCGCEGVEWRWWWGGHFCCEGVFDLVESVESE